MFCDLVGSTALADSLDPEDLADLILAYQEAVSSVIQDYGGHVAQHLGDGLLAYFGYPVAHEDSARRAVFAALRILDSIQLLNQRPAASEQLAVRIGIHTGTVVTGELGSGTTQERLALGSTPNVAAKLQGIAEPGTLVITEETRQLIGQACITEPIAAERLKSIPVPVVAHRVLARAHGPAFVPTTEMIGRARELDALYDAFATVHAGQLVPVLITAEPGLGKTRLVQAARDGLKDSAKEVWIVHCSQYEQTSALSPVVDLVKAIFQIESSMAPDESMATLTAGLEEIGIVAVETAPLLAGFLSLSPSQEFAPIDVSPQKRKELIFEAVIAILERKAKSKPPIWLVEDIHWSDPSTVEFLGLLLSQSPKLPLLLLMTSRPSFVSPWAEPVRSISLAPLNHDDAAAIVNRVAADQNLPPSIINDIIDRADGVPLFVEELTKTVIELATSSKGATGETEIDFASITIPISLQDSLVARLDRLGSAKEIAQLGAVIGREFRFDILQAVAPWSDAALLDGLKKLESADLISKSDATPDALYSFKHALVRDAAYEMLLKSARREHHLRIGTVLVEEFSDSTDARPELAAHHFSEAGAHEAAATHWLRAGQKASAESASVESISHFNQALAALKNLKPSPLVDGLELGVHLGLGPVLTLTKGYAADEVGQTYQRAEALNERIGDLRNKFWIGFAIGQFQMIQGEIATGLETGERNLALAESLEDPLFLTRAYSLLGVMSCYAAQFAQARHWLELALDQSTEPDQEFLTFAGMDLGALITMYAGWSSWHLGDSDQAYEYMQQSLADAAATGQANARGHALIMAGATISHYLGEAEAVREYSQEAVELGTKHGFSEWVLQGGLWLAWTTATSNTASDEQKSQAAEQSVEFLRAYQSGGARLSVTYFMALVAETLLSCGQFERSEALIDEALAHGTRYSDPMWEAEIHRLKGELLLRRTSNQRDNREQAGHYFEQAQNIAARQGSRALEARARASLATWSELINQPPMVTD